MPFNANNPYSIVAQVMRDPMLRVAPKTIGGHQTPMSDEEVTKILALNREGLPQSKIGLAVGRSQVAVGRLLRQPRHSAQAAQEARLEQ